MDDSGRDSPPEPKVEGEECEDDLALAGPRKDGIRVAVRVRPVSSHATGPSKHGPNASCVTFLEDKQTLALVDSSDGAGSPKSFTFHNVFAPESTQEQVFEEIGVKHLLDCALEGYACTAFAFGQTGSGKTHTMTGPDDWNAATQGIIPRAFHYLFDKAKEAKDTTFTFQASYIEIYNEQVIDLLNPRSGRGALPIRWKADRGFYVENMFVVECDSPKGLMAVLREGLRNRQTASHLMNERSSRSHAILCININAETVSSDKDGPLGAGASVTKHGSMSFVDLAGSERVTKTKSDGQQLVESNNINKSLLTLGNCISALADPRKRTGHVPYRDSALTMLLKDSLGGTGMTLMIACISPALVHMQESQNTLRYASRAKGIQNKPVVHMDPQQQLILALKREVRMLRTECAYLRQQLDGSGGGVRGDLSSNTPASVMRLASKMPSALVVQDFEEAGGLGAFARELAQTKVLLQQYMQENEDLRSENIFLYSQQQVFKAQHESVVKDNERLTKQIAQISMGGKWKKGGAAGPVNIGSYASIARTQHQQQGAGAATTPASAPAATKASSAPAVASNKGGGSSYSVGLPQSQRPSQLSIMTTTAPKSIDKSDTTLFRELQAGEYNRTLMQPLFDEDDASWSNFYFHQTGSDPGYTSSSDVLGSPTSSTAYNSNGFPSAPPSSSSSVASAPPALPGRKGQQQQQVKARVEAPKGKHAGAPAAAAAGGGGGGYGSKSNNNNHNGKGGSNGSSPTKGVTSPPQSKMPMPAPIEHRALSPGLRTGKAMPAKAAQMLLHKEVSDIDEQIRKESLALKAKAR